MIEPLEMQYGVRSTAYETVCHSLLLLSSDKAVASRALPWWAYSDSPIYYRHFLPILAAMFRYLRKQKKLSTSTPHSANVK